MGFVASLKRKYLQRQFSLFGWVHMTLLVIVVSSHFIIDNILEVSKDKETQALHLTLYRE